MNRIIIGTSPKLSALEWRESTSKASLNENLKHLKIAGEMFSLTVKISVNGSNNYITAGIPDKESKEEFKEFQSAGAMVMSAFNKIMKKPEAISLANHSIKDNRNTPVRPFNPSDDVVAKNWVLMFSAEDQKTSGDGVWLGIIYDGRPLLMTFDTFISRNQTFQAQGDIVEEVKAYMTMDSNNPDKKENDFIFLSDRQDLLDRFSDLYYENEVLEDKPFESILISFDQLIENIKHPKIEKINTGVVNPLYIAIALGLVGVGVGVNYYMGYLQEQEDQMQQAKSQQDEKRTKEENLKLQAQYEKLKAETLRKTLIEANKELDHTISIGNPSLNIDSWLNSVYKLKLNDNNWKLKQVDCNAKEGVVKCVVSLGSGDLAYNKPIMLAHPNVIINNNTATYIIQDPEIIKYKDEHYNTLPDSKSFLLNTITELQKLELAGVKYSIGKMQEITKNVVLPPPPSKVIVQNMKVDPIKMGVSTGTLKVAGTGLYLLKGLETVLSDPTLKVDKIKVVVSDAGNPTWEIEGNYFVKTADAPIMPVIEPSKIGVNVH